jgi:hypothetical protein
VNQIVVDSALNAQFAALAQPVEVVDENGRSLGRFVPTQAMLVSDDCPYSAEELAAMRSEDGGCSLTEIWKSLGAR